MASHIRTGNGYGITRTKRDFFLHNDYFHHSRVIRSDEKVDKYPGFNRIKKWPILFENGRRFRIFVFRSGLLYSFIYGTSLIHF